MRTVLMAIIVLWWCLLAIILPVILGQQVQKNWATNIDKGKTNKEIWNKETNKEHSIKASFQTTVDSRLSLLNLQQSEVLPHSDSDHSSKKERTSEINVVTSLHYSGEMIEEAFETNHSNNGNSSPVSNAKINSEHNFSLDTSLVGSSNKSFTNQYDYIYKEKGMEWNSLVLTIRSPAFFQTIHIVLTQAQEILSPGFVIQRVKGNVSWLEEVKDHGMDCYFSGTVLEQHNQSTVALSLCNGVRGVIQMNTERYYIQPEIQGSFQPNIFSETSFISVLSSYLKHYKHIITKSSIKNQHSPSQCIITANFKHHRLKTQLEKLGVNKLFYQSSSRERYRGVPFKDDANRFLETRKKRSVGVSRKHTVETLVVADAKMYEYHGKDVENYVLTLMSIVKTIYQSPSIKNFIDVVVVKLIIYEKASEIPFKVNQSAAATLKNFCQWQHKNKEMSIDHQYDTAILLTREDICRAPGKCDTLGLAELGTICDKLRSCSLIEDNGISAAFTIAHELGHVFNLPHDDDKQCSELLPDDQKLAFHVMAPTLDYNASPWDWSNCSAKLMTEFLESGLATCLLDGSRVKTWMDSMQALSEPGWTYSVNKQCKFVFGEDFVICPYSVNGFLSLH